MAPKKSVFVLISALMMLAFVTVGCERSYAPIEEGDVSQATPTVEFPEALPSDMDGFFEDGMQTLTAIASGAAPTESGPTPLAPTTETPNAADDPASPSATVATSAESTLPVMATSTNTPVVSSGNQSKYTLKKGEFPYCIARRFNVDPSELLNLNGLSNEQARSLQPGLTLNIPQGGKVFPPPRYLITHPKDNYKVPQSMTVYAVACLFGDVDPSAIISANTIVDINNIPAGTLLKIP